MLKLVCPSCSFKLEVDAGFAGGVCRCSSCGAVLSVPRDPQREPPKMIRKPSPSSSGSGRAAGSPGSSGTGSSTSAGTSAGSRAGSRTGTAAAAVPQFTTDGGGAEPALAHLAAPPPRPKPRPALVGLAVAGWATFAVEWVFVIVIVLGRGTPPPVVEAAPATASAARPTPRVQTTTTPPRPETTRPAAAPPPRPAATAPTPPAATPADPNNIFTMRRPHVLGLPLENGHTAVLFDAIERSEPWFDDGKAALKAGLTRSGNNQARVSLVTTRNKRVSRLGDAPLTPAPARLGELSRFLDPLTPAGSGGLGDALDAAVATGADRVVFVTSRSDHWGGYLGTLKGKLSPAGRTVRLDVVQIGEVSSELRGFVEQQPGGRYRLLTPQRIAGWRQAAER
ncbi:MAG: hypothetical protein AAF800_10065 [Planctomycetota bacterium]